MGRDNETTWYFDIINPVLAEICRKNGVDVYLTGNLIQSKGNMPYSMGNGWVREPRIVEKRTGSIKSMALPHRGSFALWFADMGACSKILSPALEQKIISMAPVIDPYTYFYEIEQIDLDPFSPESSIEIEKRVWNKVYNYRLDEDTFKENRKRFSYVPDGSYPLYGLLAEGSGACKPWPVSRCRVYENIDTWNDEIRSFLLNTRIQYAVHCTIPRVESSDALDFPVSGTAFSVSSIHGKEKTAITEFIKRNGGSVTDKYSPKTSVFITKQVPEKEFVEENNKITDVHKLTTNPLLNGIARKLLGDNVSLVLIDDFWNAYKKEEADGVGWTGMVLY